ncbi:MAG: tetratricopeptide repeat protein [Hyphomicrobium sp.]|nr:tetratricopeptide repeat protein [Hyphomicrobium sp.]
MIDPVRTLEREALDAQKRGNHVLAVDCWRRILNVHDNWEHGYAHYNLANCYVSLGRLDEAENEYRDAIRIEPNDALFTEALSSLQAARRDGLI